MDLVGDINDGLGEGLVPLADGAGEGRTGGESGCTSNFSTSLLVDKLARST